MVFDFLRSGFVCKARLLSDSEEETWVRWYKAPDGALPFPGWSFAESEVWIPDKDFEGPGMLAPPRFWRPTTMPGGSGQEYHGLPEWYEFGMPSSELSPLGEAESCNPPVIDPTGGLVLDGVSEITGGSVTVSLIVQKSTVSTLTTSQDTLPLGEGVAYRLSSTAPIDIRGLLDGVDGRMIMLANIGAHLINLPNEDLIPDAQYRIIAIDGVACRLYPNMETWLQYDGTTERWREINTVPLVSLQGDLLTHDGTVPAVLRSPGVSGKVLKSALTEPTGMKWGDEASAAGGDWWYWPPGATGDTPLDQWILPGSVLGASGVNEDIAPNQVVCLPLPRPRGGTIDQWGLYVATASFPVGVQVGFYRNVATTGICWPGALAGSDTMTVSGSGQWIQTLPSSIALSAGELIWVALLVSDALGASSISSIASLGACYPIFGSSNVSGNWSGPMVGVGLGVDPSGMGGGTWPYATGLPSPFPDPDDGSVDLFNAAPGFPLPAVYLRQDS